MAITLGNKTTSFSTSAVVTISYDNDGDYLFVDVSQEYDGGVGYPTGVTYNGVALTCIATKLDGGGYNRKQSVWRLVGPATGTHDLVLTWSGGGYGKLITVRSFSGVDSTTPEGTIARAGAFTAAISVGVSSAVGELVVDATNIQFVLGARTANVGAGQTEDSNFAGPQNRQTSSHEDGATNVTMSWALVEDIAPWSIIAVPLKPALPSANLDKFFLVF